MSGAGCANRKAELKSGCERMKAEALAEVLQSAWAASRRVICTCICAFAGKASFLQEVSGLQPAKKQLASKRNSTRNFDNELKKGTQPMKTKILAFLLLGLGGTLCTNQAAFAQLKIGLKISPGIAYQRVEDQTKLDELSYSSGKAGGSFGAGIVFDYFFRNNYAVNFNLLYSVKKANVKSPELGLVKWNVNMIQLPVTLKLFTNEIAPDLKLFFDVGISPDFVVGQKMKSYTKGTVPIPSNTAITIDPPEGTPYRFATMSLWMGTGVEYKVAEQTTLFAGLNYNPSLFSLVGKKGPFTETNTNKSSANQRLTLRADLISLDLGIKF